MFFEGLDRKITLQRMAQVTNAITGDVSLEVVEEVQVWAEFKALHGSERFEAEAERARANASFIIRWIENLDSQVWRVKDWNGKIWNIKGEPREGGRRDGRRKMLDLLCERMTSNE